MKARALGRLVAQPWFWATAGAILVWLIIVAYAQGAGGGAVIAAALNYSVFFAIVGLAQMLVMASGAGNIDLSIPANITLAAYLSTGQMQGADSGLMLGILAGLAGGAVLGGANAFLILAFRIPPMVATLAMLLSWSSFTWSSESWVAMDASLKGAANIRDARARFNGRARVASPRQSGAESTGRRGDADRRARHLAGAFGRPVVRRVRGT